MAVPFVSVSEELG
jgi:hypothetical protein